MVKQKKFDEEVQDKDDEGKEDVGVREPEMILELGEVEAEIVRNIQELW